MAQFWDLSVSRQSCMSCVMTTVLAILIHCVLGKMPKIVLYASRLNHKADFHNLRCFPFFSISFPLLTSESDLFVMFHPLLSFIYFWNRYISLFLKPNGCHTLGNCDLFHRFHKLNLFFNSPCFVMSHARTTAPSKMQSWSYWAQWSAPIFLASTCFLFCCTTTTKK